MTFQRFSGPELLAASAATLHTVPAASRDRVHQIRLVNNDEDNAVAATLSIGADAAATRIFSDTLAAGQSKSVRGPLTLEAGEIVQGYEGSGADSVLFNGTNQATVFNIGSAAFAPGDLTMAMVVKQPDNSSIVEYPLYVGDSIAGADRYAIYHQTNGRMGIQIGNNVVDAPTVTFRHSNQWTLIAVTHAAGATTPRFHSYDWNTTTWIHEDGGSTIADGTLPNQFASVGFFISGTDWFHGNVLIAGIWNSVLNDAAVEALIGGKSQWSDATVAWRFDETTPDAFAGTSTWNNGEGTLDSGDVPAGWAGAVTATIVGIRESL
jgi:hypothetical protein